MGLGSHLYFSSNKKVHDICSGERTMTTPSVAWGPEAMANVVDGGSASRPLDCRLAPPLSGGTTIRRCYKKSALPFLCASISFLDSISLCLSQLSILSILLSQFLCFPSVSSLNRMPSIESSPHFVFFSKLLSSVFSQWNLPTFSPLTECVWTLWGWGRCLRSAMLWGCVLAVWAWKRSWETERGLEAEKLRSAFFFFSFFLFNFSFFFFWKLKAYFNLIGK